MSKKTCIVLVGPPCSGKSTTGKLTASKMNIEYISSGDIAREMAKHDVVINADLSAGYMAPEDKMRKSISDKLWYNLFTKGKDVVILDGFPRFGDQANWLQNEVALNNINIYYVIFNITSLSTIIDRSVHRGRNDDKNLETRLDYYFRVTFPELGNRINYFIDADENTVEECSELLTKYIKEVTNK